MENVQQIVSLIAHRGASAYAPENTMAAFNRAIQLGAHAIEFDVAMNEAGDLFVFHDEDLSRIANVRGRLHDATTTHLDNVDVGSWFSETYQNEKLPRLQNILQWVAEHNIQANIELKPHLSNKELFVTHFLSCLNQYWMREQSLLLISSFDFDVLNLIRQLSPELPIGLLFSKWNKHWADMAKEIGAYSIHLPERAVTKKRLKEIKAEGYKICIFTVNSRKWALRYFAWGADSVFTDYPDLMEV